MTKKDTQLATLKFDINYAYSRLDHVYAVFQLLKTHLDVENIDQINTWTVRSALSGLMAQLIDIQAGLEENLEEKP